MMPEARVKPIPALYCCYLLRSSVRHTSLYVGSTPHPSRRLAQHNGKSKGGAVRTSRISLRPWEMTCIVNGFPSNIAALQFEWAWQNAHLSRHILPDERISFPVTLTRTNRKTGKTRKKPGRPRTTMVERLSNLHLLLRTRYFSQWPLELRFFSEDVYRQWKSWCNRVDSQVRPEIKIFLDPTQTPHEDQDFSSAQRVTKRKKFDLIGRGGVEGLDPTYARYQHVLEKSQFLDVDDQHICKVCQNNLDIRNELYTVCAHGKCTSLSHVVCLSDKSLREEGFAEGMIPTKSTCPQCKQQSLWSDVMRTVSLRIRGEKEVKKLLKKGRGTKTVTGADILEEEEDDDNDDEEEEDAFDDSMMELDDEDDDDRMSVSSIGSAATDTISPMKKSKEATKLEIVIEDSEDER